MTNEPKYDEDVVNLGYLNRVIDNTEENINREYENVSRHYGSQPTPPYYKGDTWVDGNIVYTCINTRKIGTYQNSDWTTESGATELATKKNQVFLRQPSNYNAGDMWILQNDNDHKAGVKGEILISIAGRKEYDPNDWINMLGYGTIRSINEVAGNLNGAIDRIGVVEAAIADGVIITFYQSTIPEGVHIGDLWYVTGKVENYIEGKLYRYDGENWCLLDDPDIQKAFDEANEARLVADGKIQSFYSKETPTKNLGVGDLWIDLANDNKLYRYNGTNWIAVYDTRIDELEETTTETTERVTSIESDLGKIDLKVSENTKTITTVSSKLKEKVKGVDVMYALGTSETVAPISGWSTISPKWENGKYMWQKTLTIYEDDKIIQSEPICISGAKGEKGDTGIGVKNIVVQYYLSTSSTTQTGGSWKDTQDEWKDGYYIWTRSQITWTDNSISYTIPVLANGINGVLKNISTIKTNLADLSVENDKISAKVSETTTKVEDLESSIEYFSTDLDLYNLVIPVDTLKKPTESSNYYIGYYSYFKGKQITPKVEILSTISGFSMSIENSRIKISTNKDTSISNEINEVEINFSYSNYSIKKKITLVLAQKGEKGETGASGKSSYFYVRYSENPTGNPMTTAPTANTKYMGVASTTSSTAPTSYAAYTWSNIKGADGKNGSAGQAGVDGRTSYLHIKYSEDGTTFTPAEDEYELGEKPSAYVGQYVDFNKADSTNFEDYKWYKFTEDIDHELNNMKNSIDETKTKLKNDYLTTEQIESKTENLKEDINVIKKQQASMELTSTGLQIQIDTINNEGVKNLKNTLVEIDEEGIKVSKGSEFNSLLNDTGVYLKSYEKEIASYTKDGARMYNLTVQNEAQIGNLKILSVEVNSKKRTHIHWIGG